MFGRLLTCVGKCQCVGRPLSTSVGGVPEVLERCCQSDVHGVLQSPYIEFYNVFALRAAFFERYPRP